MNRMKLKFISIKLGFIKKCCLQLIFRPKWESLADYYSYVLITLIFHSRLDNYSLGPAFN